MPVPTRSAQPNGKPARRFRQRTKGAILRAAADELASQICRITGKGRLTRADFSTAADNLTRIILSVCGIAPIATPEGAR